MNLAEQVNLAIKLIKDTFKDNTPKPPIPKDATLQSLWDRICDLERAKKKTAKPSVEESAKLLLEHPDLAEIPIPMIAEIIREVYAAYGIGCKCSESSIRWYQSQRSLEWNIVRRKLHKVEVVRDAPIIS